MVSCEYNLLREFNNKSIIPSNLLVCEDTAEIRDKAILHVEKVLNRKSPTGRGYRKEFSTIV